MPNSLHARSVVPPPQKIEINAKDIELRIVGAKEERFFFVEGDVVYCKNIKNVSVNVDDVINIYHIGPSGYDLTLEKAKHNQANLVGKLTVTEIKNNVVTGRVIRTFSPIVVGDVLIMSK